MKKLELRMYGFVPYNLSGIQKGIQFGHGVVEYGLEFFNDDKYQDWAKCYKTFIILDGGTSNHSTNRYMEDSSYKGTMEIHKDKLSDNGVQFGTFFEPDLNDMLSAIVFIVDERVFSKDYLEFGDWVLENFGDEIYDINEYSTSSKISNDIKSSNRENDKKLYKRWVEYIGGDRNVFLRDYLSRIKLASN